MCEAILKSTSPLFARALSEAGLGTEEQEEVFGEVSKFGSCQNIDRLPEDIRHRFVVASDITPEEHVRMQAAIQAFVDNSLSKTVNFPAGATPDEVEQELLDAMKKLGGANKKVEQYLDGLAHDAEKPAPEQTPEQAPGQNPDHVEKPAE